MNPEPAPPPGQAEEDALSYQLVDDSLLLSLGPDVLLYVLEARPPMPAACTARPTHS